jgi:CRP-like cAMP-binding protein
MPVSPERKNAEQRLSAGRYALFNGLSSGEMAQVAGCVSKRTFGKGAYLYHPGNPARNFYLVESGLVRLFFTDASGQEYLLELAGPGAMIGVPLLYEDQLRALGAAAVVPSVVLCLSQQDLAHFAGRFPRLMSNIYRSLDGGMRKLILFIKTLVILGVEGRLAFLVLHLSEVCGAQGDPDEFESPVSQAELARWLGASRGHLNRALGRLQQSGLIRVKGQTFTILDRAGLQRMTQDLDAT